MGGRGKLEHSILGTLVRKRMAAPSFRAYETLYGVGLLDDLHNYFPALLYESASFQTVPEVLAYVQVQTRQRFDLFSLGRGAYVRNNQRAAPPLYRPTRFVFSEEGVNVNTYDAGTNSIINLFANMLGSNFLNPVIVRPSAQIINANTTLSTLGAVTNEVCAVCQDGFEVGNERRSLNACHHTFHRACIDIWFQENVHCPVCRHDIRVSARAPMATATATPSPS